MSGTSLQPPARPADSPFRFEGVLGEPRPDIENLNLNAQAFLPYNPTIVEIGAYEGDGTVGLAQAYPHGRIFACEPNPRAFSVLAERVRPLRNVVAVDVAFAAASGRATLHLGCAEDERHASLLAPEPPAPPTPAPAASVSTTTLDDWCRQRALGRVDFLRLDAGGLELQILQHARVALASALAVVTRTHFYRASSAIASFPIVRAFLQMAGFELVSHWYEQGRHGEATFVSRVLYDSVFR